MAFKIFKGIYKNLGFSNSNNIFENKLYLRNNKKKFEKLISNDQFFNEYAFINYITIFSLFKKNRILDIGGGFFNSFLKLYNKESKLNIYFDILENPNLLDYINSENLLKRIKIPKTIKLRIFSNRKRLYPYYDIFHFGSIIQYVDDLEYFLKSFFDNNINPEFLIFSDVYAGDIKKNYFTKTDYYGLKHLIKIRSKKLFEKKIMSFGYEIVNVHKMILPVRGKFKFYNMSNLPKENRIYCTYNYLFKKINKN